MANAALLIGWKDTKVGREALAAELFTSTLAYYTSKVQDGTLESFEPVILARHGGDLNGFFLVRGERDQLSAWRKSEDFENWLVKAVICLEGFGVVEGYIGEGLMQLMQRWTVAIPKG